MEEKDVVQEYGLDSPAIEAGEHWFTVTFKRKTEGKGLEKGTEKKAQKTKDRILESIAANPHTTIDDLVRLLTIGDRRIKKHLAGLKAQGMLKRIGPDKGGYWEVVQKP